jgi:DNA topoisomerase-1
MPALPPDVAAPGDLVYSDDAAPGITRVRRGKGFSFHLPGGARITDEAEISRLKAIGMPPAYLRCWFNPDPAGHIQATGYDARGRKQYRYHPAFRLGQEASKFALCTAFGEALPKMRARVAKALGKRSLTRERTLAGIVRLLDTAHFRIGNRQYARDNRSFGVSTLRKRHVALRGTALEWTYRGKSGRLHRRVVQDRALLRVVRDLQDLPGQHLFKYRDEAGELREISSHDVNRYIAETMGSGFSAKHFRTWGGTLVAFEAWLSARGNITLDGVLRHVAIELGNTPAVSRKSYVHPAVLAAIKGKLAPPTRLPRRTQWLEPAERALIAFLRASGSP